MRDAVGMQEDIGLEVATDGEFRRGSYWGRFVERIDGLAMQPGGAQFPRRPRPRGRFHRALCGCAAMRRTQPLALDEFVFLRDVTTATPKITLPAPSTMHFLRCTDFADASRLCRRRRASSPISPRSSAQEIADLVAAGCRYIQFDEVAVALLCDPAIRRRSKARAATPTRWSTSTSRRSTTRSRARPADVVFGVHMCRGNFKGHYLAAGRLRVGRRALLRATRVNHFLLEYDTQRAGDFAPLRFVPKDKGVVLGLVSSKTPALESLDDAASAAPTKPRKYIDLDRLAISPQCGFASSRPAIRSPRRTSARSCGWWSKPPRAIWR